MTGGLIYLVSKNMQDMYLSGDPQVTFFKLIYRRHTYFAFESVVQKFKTAPDFGQKVTCEIPPIAGDLMSQTFLFVQIPPLPLFHNQQGEIDRRRKVAWVEYLGYAIVQEISIDIGGVTIDKHYGEWMYLWNQLTQKKRGASDKMVGHIPPLFHFTPSKEGYNLYIPLEFWFCRQVGLALPLVSLTSSPVKISVVFRKIEECLRVGPTHSILLEDSLPPLLPGDYIEQTVRNETVTGYVIDYDPLERKLFYLKMKNEKNIAFQSPPEFLNPAYAIYKSGTGLSASPQLGAVETVENTFFLQKPQIVQSFFYINFIYLDQSERQKFLTGQREYLIEQLQFQNEINLQQATTRIRLNFNHPVKSLYWVVQPEQIRSPGSMNGLFQYTGHHTEFLKKAKITLNGFERIQREALYFHDVQSYQHHTNPPPPGVYLYSFSMYPEQFQPSGSCNLSQLNQTEITLQLQSPTPYQVRIYAVNYNIFRVFSHVGSLVFI